jgi:hypothetical protein
MAAIVGLVVAIAPQRAEAQILENYDYEDLEFRGIGLEAGRIWPGRVEATTSYGLRLDLGMIGPRVRIVPTARFWSSSLIRSEVDGLADQIILVCERQGDVSCPERLDLGEVRLSDLEMSTDAHLLLFPDRILSPYLGLNLGLHLLNGRGDFIDGTFVEDLLDTVAPGLGSMIGFTVQLGSALLIGAEARGMVGSDVRYTAISAMGSWLLPGPGVDETLGLRRNFRR